MFRGNGLFPLSNTGVIFGGPLGVTTATNRPTGAVGTRIRAPIGGVATPSGNNAIFGDGFKFSDFGQLTSDLRRCGANLFANYDLTDQINIFVKAQYFGSRADELVQQPTFNTPLFGGANGLLIRPGLVSSRRTTSTRMGASARCCNTPAKRCSRGLIATPMHASSTS